MRLDNSLIDNLLFFCNSDNIAISISSNFICNTPSMFFISNIILSLVLYVIWNANKTITPI
ncbi:hypothetical protein CBE01nite_04710 [Clostridium beijerinckii]|nr:hypothetical protein CBE01nite_04710 [Clostridium beijerinckii]